MQTVDIWLPSSELKFQTFEIRPICPVKKLFRGEKVTVTKENRTYYEWYSGGAVKSVKSNGTVKIWYPKPTIKDIIENRNNYKGTFTQFHKDDTVSCRWDGSTYYYGKQMKGSPIKGEFWVDTCTCTECLKDY